MQPEYQLTNPYARILGYFNDSQPAGIGYKPNVGDKISDTLRNAYESLPGYDYVTDKGSQTYSSGLMDMLNRGFVAGTAGAPVDIANTLIGTRWPELQSEKPFMGSEWLGQKMQDYGMVSPVRRPLGEAVAGFADPETMGIAATKLAALGKVAGAGHSLAMLPGMLGKLEQTPKQLEGVAKTLLNSEGRPIHPTEDGVRNFWDWFGDSAVTESAVSSKQKRSELRPLVVYHGTRANFDAFAPVREGNVTTLFGDNETVARHGIFFAENPEFAGTFAHQAGAGSESFVPAYLSIQNPMYLDKGFTGEIINKLRSAGLPDDQCARLRHRKVDMSWAEFDGESGQALVRAAKSAGYDGAFMLEPGIGLKGEEQQNVWVAFDPEQIKSATGNTGAFNPTDPSIVKAKGGSVHYADGGRVGQYQLTDPYTRVLRYFDDSQPAGIGYKPNIGDKTGDALRKAYESLPGYDYVTDKGNQAYSSGLMDMLNRGLVAGTAGVPVDIANTVIGTRWPNLQTETPVGGSEWLGQKMQDYGMVSPVRRPLGEAAAGLIDPETLGIAAAKIAALGKVAGAGHSVAMLPGFFSKLERGLASAPEQALTSGNAAKQWLSANANKYGIKQAEIEATGIGSHLENLGKGKTSRENLLDVVKAGDPGIKEVVKGQPMSSEQQVKFEGLKNEITEIEQRDLEGKLTRDEAQHLISKVFDNYGIKEEEYYNIPTKHPTRVLPGGENYREVLLTLPSDDISMVTKNLENEIANQQEIIRQSYSYAEKHPEGAQRLFSIRENAIKKLNTAKEELIAIKSKPREFKSSHFKSSHWEEPNVLAHFRTNDRIGPNGEKQLFVEELQSDWGQKGRRVGFDSDKPMYDALPDGYVVKSRKKIDASGNESEFPRYWVEDTNGSKVTAEGYNRQSVINDVINDLNNQARGTTESTVPSAPYITNTKDWTELGIKRIMHHAAKNGYDQVAFINGAQSADRYDLSKAVDHINAEAVSDVDGLHFVDIFPNDGDEINLEVENGIIREGEFSGKPLSDIVGKEMSDKILSLQQGDTKKYSDTNLKIGGEGMKKFYDEIVPQAAGKFAKQYGAPFGVKPMETGDQFTIDITPTMRKDIVEKGIPAFADGGSVHYADGGPINTDEDSYGQPFGDEIAKLYRGGSYADGGSVTDGATPYVPEQIDLLIKQLYEGL